jgi:hypothetical protein
MLIEHRTSHLN